MNDMSSMSTSRTRAWWVVVGVVVLVAAGVVATLSLRSSASAGTITVTGSGTAQGVPDTLSFQIGVNTTASSAVAALEKNNTQMSALEASLMRSGLAKSDMQTSDLSVSTNTDSAGRVTGFSVSDTLSVTTHHLKNAGQTLDAAVHAVGNGAQLYGVSFSLSNQSRALAAARAQAMKNAHAAASQIASAGSTSVGHIVKITDQENASSPPIVMSSGFNALKAAVPLQSGTQTVSVLVTVVYALNG